MKDEICQYFQQGRCKYGNNCSRQHITISSLLDPPTWIYSYIPNLTLNVISPEEFRYSLLINDTRRILDDMWIENYAEMYKYLNNLCKKGIVKSTSKRCIDLRKHPECFNLPFDIEYVELKILKLREKYPIFDKYEIIVSDEDTTISDFNVENAPSFVKEYAYKKEAEETRHEEENIRGGRDWNNKIQKYNQQKGNYQSKNFDQQKGNYQSRNFDQQKGNYKLRNYD